MSARTSPKRKQGIGCHSKRPYATLIVAVPSGDVTSSLCECNEALGGSLFARRVPGRIDPGNSCRERLGRKHKGDTAMDTKWTMQEVTASELCSVEGGVLLVVLAALGIAWGVAAVGTALAFGIAEFINWASS